VLQFPIVDDAIASNLGLNVGFGYCNITLGHLQVGVSKQLLECKCVVAVADVCHGKRVSEFVPRELRSRCL